MYKVKIYDTYHNVSKQVYYHIEGILAENRVLSSEIRAHEDTEKRLREDIDTYQKTLDEVTSEKMDLEEVIDKAIELLGNYKHYSTPDEKQNSENEDLVNNAFDILKEVE